MSCNNNSYITDISENQIEYNILPKKVYRLPSLINLGISPPSKFALIEDKIKKSNLNQMDKIIEDDNYDYFDSDTFIENIRKEILNDIEKKINDNMIIKKNKTRRQYMETIHEIPEKLENHNSSVKISSIKISSI